METGLVTTFVGIDVSKHRWDVHLLPAGESWKFDATDEGLRQLREVLARQARCHIVLEASGGYEKRLAAELLEAGHLVSRGKSATSHAAWDAWPRPIASTPPYWRCTRSASSRVLARNCPKNSRNSSCW